MTTNPFVNALAALAYIVVVVLVMHYATKLPESGDSPIVPIAFISLFTLSAAVMGYIFLYQPLQLYFEGEKKQAVNVFLKTVAVFAGITVLLLLGLFSRLL